MSKPKHCHHSLTYLVAPLPLECHLPEPNMHDIVIGLRCVTNLADDVALLHLAVTFVLQLANGATDSLHGALPCCCVCGRRWEMRFIIVRLIRFVCCII